MESHQMCLQIFLEICRWLGSSQFQMLVVITGLWNNLNIFKVLNKIINPVDQTVQGYNAALKSNFPDFEDALQHFAALESKADCILTEYKKDYKKSAISVFTTKEYLARSN